MKTSILQMHMEKYSDWVTLSDVNSGKVKVKVNVNLYSASS